MRYGPRMRVSVRLVTTGPNSAKAPVLRKTSACFATSVPSRLAPVRTRHRAEWRRTVIIASETFCATRTGRPHFCANAKVKGSILAPDLLP